MKVRLSLDAIINRESVDFEIARQDLEQEISARTLKRADINARCIVDGEERLRNVYKNVEGADPLCDWAYLIHVKTAAGEREGEDILTLRYCWRVKTYWTDHGSIRVWDDPKGSLIDPRQSY